VTLKSWPKNTPQKSDLKNLDLKNRENFNLNTSFQVEFADCPVGLSGVICGENFKGEMVSGIFLGVHSKTELLFCPKEIETIKYSKILYSNSFITISNSIGKICLLSSRNGLLCQGLKLKQNSKVEIIQTAVSPVNTFYGIAAVF